MYYGRKIYIINFKNRLISNRIVQIHRKQRGRILVITGARQTGKTTLASKVFHDHLLLSMDDPLVRPEFSRLTAKDWINRYPLAVIDEIQKLPSLMDSIKACYDSNPDVRYVLLGSSQIMLLEGIRESLAGRAEIQELYPLTLPELLTDDWSESAKPSRLIRWLSENPRQDPRDYLEGIVSINERYAAAKKQWEYYIDWGGMPALTHHGYNDEDRRKWLEDYFSTYLQRDLSDLGRLNELEPFIRAQQATALRTTRPINFSELGRLSGVSPQTAKKFMRYLELSYQVILLPAFSGILKSAWPNSPKLSFWNPGSAEASCVKAVYSPVQSMNRPLSGKFSNR